MFLSFLFLFLTRGRVAVFRKELGVALGPARLDP